jgi:hypothetical protein
MARRSLAPRGSGMSGVVSVKPAACTTFCAIHLL